METPHEREKRAEQLGLPVKLLAEHDALMEASQRGGTPLPTGWPEDLKDFIFANPGLGDNVRVHQSDANKFFLATWLKIKHQIQAPDVSELLAWVSEQHGTMPSGWK
jgi:hypothetical protein